MRVKFWFIFVHNHDINSIQLFPRACNTTLQQSSLMKGNLQSTYQSHNGQCDLIYYSVLMPTGAILTILAPGCHF